MNSSQKKLKYLFVARGPGEAGQARSLAKYIADKGYPVTFSLLEKKTLHFFASDKNFKIKLTEKPASLIKLIQKEKPDVFLLFNSKTWASHKEFYKKPPFKKNALVVAVDSNWLFNQKKYNSFHFINWADKYFVLFPKKVFDLGLKKHGGGFVIKNDVLKNIVPVGFIPTYPKISGSVKRKTRNEYGIIKGEKLIFAYFSGFGAGHRIFAFNNLIDSVESLTKKGGKIKVLYVGPTEPLDPVKLKKSWVITKDKLSAQEYYQTLSSADLIFQHQGMVTLSQAISASVPTIANVGIRETPGIPKIHFWEVGPFARIGACRMLTKSTPMAKINKEIETLLYSKKSIKKMRNVQKSILEKGEKNAFAIIQKLIKEKK